MRIGEAANLKNSDVDMVSRSIIIRDSKNRRERLLPINESLFKVFEQYLVKRDKLPLSDINSPDSPFWFR